MEVGGGGCGTWLRWLPAMMVEVVTNRLVEVIKYCCWM